MSRAPGSLGGSSPRVAAHRPDLCGRSPLVALAPAGRSPLVAAQPGWPHRRPLVDAARPPGIDAVLWWARKHR